MKSLFLSYLYLLVTSVSRLEAKLALLSDLRLLKSLLSSLKRSSDPRDLIPCFLLGEADSVCCLLSCCLWILFGSGFGDVGRDCFSNPSFFGGVLGLRLGFWLFPDLVVSLLLDCNGLVLVFLVAESVCTL